jgi:hypothetical protein
MKNDTLVEIGKDLLSLAALEDVDDRPVEVVVAEFAVPRCPRRQIGKAEVYLGDIRFRNEDATRKLTCVHT